MFFVRGIFRGSGSIKFFRVENRGRSGMGYWNVKKGILGERNRLCSDEEREEWGIGLGVVGLFIWVMCEGE